MQEIKKTNCGKTEESGNFSFIIQYKMEMEAEFLYILEWRIITMGSSYQNFKSTVMHDKRVLSMETQFLTSTVMPQKKFHGSKLAIYPSSHDTSCASVLLYI